MFLMTSRGCLVKWDDCAGGVSGDLFPAHVLRNRVIPWRKTRVTSSRNAVKAILKQSDEKKETWLPDKEDVGVFPGSIVFVAQEVEFRWNNRGT